MVTKKAPSKKSAAKKSTKKSAKKSGAKRAGGKAVAKFGGSINWGADLNKIIKQLMARGSECQRRCVRTFLTRINKKGADIEAANTQLRRCIRRCESTSLSDLLDGHL